MGRKWRQIKRNWQGTPLSWRPLWLLFFLSFFLTIACRYFTEAARKETKPWLSAILWVLEGQAPSPVAVVSSQLGFLEGGRSFPADVVAKAPKPAPKKKADPKPTVAIFHTHTGESYVATRGKEREMGQEGCIVDVGAALAQGLRAHGFGVIHERKVHDGAPWHLSYTRSRATVRQLQEQHPSLKIFIDVHRDGINTPNIPKSTTTAQVGGEEVAKIMLYVGSDKGGKAFPNRQAVYDFNRQLQKTMEQLYPGLARPLFTKGLFPHNQDLADQFILVEFGDARLNTKEEAERAAGLFADSLALMLYERE